MNSDQRSDTGISNTWAAWSTAYDHPATAESIPPNPPLSTHDISNSESVDSQVKQILATMVHNLGKGNAHPFDFPYKYILQGPEKIEGLY